MACPVVVILVVPPVRRQAFLLHFFSFHFHYAFLVQRDTVLVTLIAPELSAQN